jgi:ABC-type branched-subunit amino acid transport system permease subunit
MPSKWQKMLKITYFGWATLIFGEYFTVALLNANKIFLTKISLITVRIGRRFVLKIPVMSGWAKKSLGRNTH